MGVKKNKWIIIIITALIVIIASVLIYHYAFHNQNVGHQHSLSQLKKKEYWTCPMHPQIISDRPGVCPICNMELIKKVTEDSNESHNMKNMIKLTDNKLVLADVSTVHIHKEKLIKKVTAYSYLDFADQARRVIPAKFSGRVEKLYVDKTGDYIKSGEALFEVYSPDLVQAQNEYLIALDSKNHSQTLMSAKKKLRLFGITELQIKELEETREVKYTIPYYSPFSGIVIEKKVLEGMYFNEGTTLYDIADLSVLWNVAEIYERDLDVVTLGSISRFTLQSYPGEKFLGRISLIYPVVNPQTRTVRIRIEVNNRNGKMKPQMYGETTFEKDYGSGLVLPSDAILFTGKKNIVWLKVGDGMFEPRSIEVGKKFGDNYHILSGLDEGDEVAITGGYLIDSESQLKTGMTTGHQHGEEPKKETESSDKHKGHLE